METSGKFGSSLEKGSLSLDRRVCVAPMMDYTVEVL
jgi:hypothetical protein